MVLYSLKRFIAFVADFLPYLHRQLRPRCASTFYGLL